MDNRARILEAAGRVYAVHGFRGATTRRIAQEAGVNEVTLFRLFGSKARLFQALHDNQFHAGEIPRLPARPGHPEAELVEWLGAVLAHMREHRAMLRKLMAEVEENPEMARAACEGPHCAAEMLVQYVGQLRAQGLASPDADVETAVSVIMSAIWGDAMVREVMPEAFPRPEARAPWQYARHFLRALGVPDDARADARADARVADPAEPAGHQT
ncbi:MAG TPA: TetR/AcrR family transcriptional regulator [Gemmatimonadaceae bacterium]